METPNENIKSAPLPKCPNCWKSGSLCLCSQIQPLDNALSVLVLQHPQEARNPATTARLVTLTLKNSVHKVGLSWRTLKQALGREATPSKWAVLFLGTKTSADKFKHLPFCVIDSRDKILKNVQLEGVIVLDGNWKQSKTLWWRNPWFSRMNRIILNPKQKAAFDAVRKEPRKNSLSTLEAVVQVFETLEPKNSQVPASLKSLLNTQIDLLRPPKKTPVVGAELAHL